MIRFMKTNYNKEQLQELSYLLSEDLRILRMESECDCSSDCHACQYKYLCYDLHAFKGYVDELLKGGEV